MLNRPFTSTSIAACRKPLGSRRGVGLHCFYKVVLVVSTGELVSRSGTLQPGDRTWNFVMVIAPNSRTRGCTKCSLPERPKSFLFQCAAEQVLQNPFTRTATSADVNPPGSLMEGLLTCSRHVVRPQLVQWKWG